MKCLKYVVTGAYNEKLINAKAKCPTISQATARLFVIFATM